MLWRRKMGSRPQNGDGGGRWGADPKMVMEEERGADPKMALKEEWGADPKMALKKERGPDPKMVMEEEDGEQTPKWI